MKAGERVILGIDVPVDFPRDRKGAVRLVEEEAM